MLDYGGDRSPDVGVHGEPVRGVGRGVPVGHQGGAFGIRNVLDELVSRGIRFKQDGVSRVAVLPGDRGRIGAYLIFRDVVEQGAYRPCRSAAASVVGVCAFRGGDRVVDLKVICSL
ncbi:MAG: hypothetical protein IJI66_14545 [Erysipelotrichaceae bacterium]|nr:hypothetical protein [Erysipelotrichaceae bacterium]